jgi:SAM-dependent methyltransferase
MFDPKDEDFAAIAAWGLDKNPLRAIDDFKPEQLDARWNNAYQKEAHAIYHKKREDYIQSKNFDDYYKKAEKPIDKHRWTYLKDRKAWYILPLEWQRFAEPGVKRVLDLGCGDGDVTQRMADFIAKCWKEKGYAGHALEITGYDLNASRIKNAQSLCVSPHPLITFKFDVCDAIGKGIPHPDQYFDYSGTTGVFEILEDAPAEKFMAEICRVTAKGVYVEDLADEYPGGYPRDTFEAMFAKNGFTIERKHWILTEPFVEQGTLDPMKLWPALKDLVLFAVRK